MRFVNLPNYLFVKEVIPASGVSSVNFMTFHTDLFCSRMSELKNKNKIKNHENAQILLANAEFCLLCYLVLQYFSKDFILL